MQLWGGGCKVDIDEQSPISIVELNKGANINFFTYHIAHYNSRQVQCFIKV